MSRGLVIREWERADKPSLTAHANNIRVWNNLRDYFPSPYTPEDGEKFIEMVLQKPRPVTDFAISVEGKAVGGIGLILQTDVQRISAEVGFWLGEDYWNKGIMTAALKELVEYSFTRLPLVKLYATVFDFNTGSQKVLTKAGFEKEAVLKRAAMKNDKIIDLHYYGLIKPGYL
ncbi:MAG: GNAT family N-acetyltransferase [Leadbetterella sp.]|nr:GNAT family N-acetyltransferase [Leadbetterella sp.]